MDERVIHLTDGSTIEAKVNFATLYYIQKFGIDKMMNKKKLSADEEMELSAKMLHVIMLSNGKTCTFEDALVLLPLDDMEFEDVIEDFEKKIDDYKKKQDAKRAERKFQAAQST